MSIIAGTNIWHQQSRKFDENIPLKFVKCDGEFFGSFGVVRVEQTFTNNYTNPIEASYTFSLTQNSVVKDLKMIIGDKKLIGIIKERSEAKKDYETAISEKKKTTLLEKISDTDYKVSLGNLTPNETITIEFTYLTVAFMDSDGFKFVLPTNIAPKYTGSSDFSTRDKVDEIVTHYDNIPYTTNTTYDFNLNLTWKSKNKITSVKSLTNELTVEDISDTHKKINCKTSPKIGDFNLFVQTEIGTCVYHQQHKDSHYIGISHQIPDVIINNQVSHNYTFVLDRSGSMNGTKIQQAVEALKLFVQSLEPNSWFNVVSFGSRYSALWSNSVKYTDENVATCLNKVSNFGADMGGTEIYQCLKDSIESKLTNSEFITERICPDSVEKVYILLTDGDVSNINAIANLLQENKGKCRVFAIGIGNDANRNLIQKMAESSDGMYKMIVDEAKTGDVVVDMMTYVSKQHYRDLELQIGESVFNAATSIYPNQYVSAFVTLTNEEFNELKNVTLMALDPNTGSSIIWKINCDEIMNIDGVCQFYGKDELEKIINKFEHVSDSFNYYNADIEQRKFYDEEKQKILKKIAELSIKYHIMTKYTSFIIVDDVVNDIKLPMEKVVVPHHNDDILNNIFHYHCATIIDFKLPNDITCDPNSLNYFDCSPTRVVARACGATLPFQYGGVNTVDSTLKNATHNIRSTPINPKLSRFLEARTESAKTTLADVSDAITKVDHKFYANDISNLMKHKLANGSFEFDECQRIEITKIANDLNVNPKTYFNVMVWVILHNSGETKYKLILRNLENWLNNNYKEVVPIDDLKTHVRLALND